MFAEFGLSTDMVDAKIRDDFWRDVSKVLYDISSVEKDGHVSALTGSVHSRPFGSMILGLTSFNRQICRRTPQSIVRSALDMFILQLVVKGDYRADFNGVDLFARPGDIFILDLAQALDSQKESGARLSLVIPRPMLQKCLPNLNLHGLVLHRKHASTRLLADYMIGIEKVLGDLKPDEIEGVQESITVLLSTAIRGTTGDTNSFALNLPMRQRIVDYIDSRLSDPKLGPEMIIRHFRVSRSHLYRAFEVDGGVARLIRTKRLDHAYDLLTRSSAKAPSVKEVVRNCGISEGTEFAKMFKSRFGLTPKEARSLAMDVPRRNTTALVLHDYLLAEASRKGLQG